MILAQIWASKCIFFLVILIVFLKISEMWATNKANDSIRTSMRWKLGTKDVGTLWWWQTIYCWCLKRDTPVAQHSWCAKKCKFIPWIFCQKSLPMCIFNLEFLFVLCFFMCYALFIASYYLPLLWIKYFVKETVLFNSPKNTNINSCTLLEIFWKNIFEN